ncbi:MAG TPA: GNAT family N-acetyltransferase [Chitinophagales bacterium]|nr:GNAT family N-acetyltransferase [Chitinophagales bacterium]
MIFREATVADIKEMHLTRMSVKENRLSNPSIIREVDYINFLTLDGKGWVCESDGSILGLSIIDTKRNNIWGLFVHPDHERKGIGRKLFTIMIDWHFNQKQNTLWLGTAPNTRAAEFYRKAGWKEIGLQQNGEIKFELAYEDWKKNRSD